MKFTLAIIALLSASVSSMRLTADAEIKSLADLDAMALANLHSAAMEELEEEIDMTPAQ